MERRQTPLFEERFRGYGYNKAIWTRWIAALGTKFMVHPTAFMVHQPHTESCAKALWRDSMPEGLPEKANPKVVVSGDAHWWTGTCLHRHCMIVASSNICMLACEPASWQALCHWMLMSLPVASTTSKSDLSEVEETPAVHTFNHGLCQFSIELPQSRISASACQTYVIVDIIALSQLMHRLQFA